MTQGLPEHMIESATYRRGGLAVFDRIEPAKTALLVIDMQNAWLAPGAPFETPPARAIIPAINRLAAALRSRGGLIVWVQHTSGPPGSAEYWPMYFEHFVRPAERAALAATSLTQGHKDHEIYPELDARPEDIRLLKTRFSVFTRNPAEPEALLRGRGIDTMIVAGTATNICCESTAREAKMRDFRVFMPYDAVAAPRDDGHEAGLRTVMQAFADVRKVDDIVPLMDSQLR
jgi:ureidoacrylate peracid hydrolase